MATQRVQRVKLVEDPLILAFNVLPVPIAPVHLTLDDLLEYPFLFVGLIDGGFVDLIVAGQLLHHIIVILHSLQQFIGLKQDMFMIFLLVVAELPEGVHDIELYLFADDLNLFGEFVEDIDDVFAEEDDAFLFPLVDFQSSEEAAASIGEFVGETSKECYDAFGEFLNVFSAFLIKLEFVFEDGMEEGAFPHEQFTHAPLYLYTLSNLNRYKLDVRP